MDQFKWIISPYIISKTEEIEVLKRVFEMLPLSPTTTKIIRDRSFLNSAVSSARIEDIPSTIQLPRKEGKNLEGAYQWICSQRQLPDLTIEIVRELHNKTMYGLSGSAGKYRTEAWGVFNQSGMEVMHAPLHTLIPDLMQEFVTFINSLNEHPCVVAAIGQFVFEKIHPFADGNGRTGRLISTYLLTKSGYGFGGLIPIEKYINEHRNWYYQTLEPSSNCTEFVDYFLESLISQANQTLEEVKNPLIEIDSSNLLPRRRELLEVIKDHPECSFDFLHRRFMNQSPLSLHRDLKHLMQKKLIKKLGSTRGVVYDIA